MEKDDASACGGGAEGTVTALGNLGIIAEDSWGGLKFAAFGGLLPIFKATCSNNIQTLTLAEEEQIEESTCS